MDLKSVSLHRKDFMTLHLLQFMSKTVAVKSVEHFDVISQIYDDSFSLITSGCSGSLREQRERACVSVYFSRYPPNGEFARSSTVPEKEPALIPLKEALPIRKKRPDSEVRRKSSLGRFSNIRPGPSKRNAIKNE